jgi:hypothetical protein
MKVLGTMRSQCSSGCGADITMLTECLTGLLATVGGSCFSAGIEASGLGGAGDER